MASFLFRVQIQVSKVKRKWYTYGKGFRKTGSGTTNPNFSGHLPQRPQIPVSLNNLLQRNNLVTLGFFKMSIASLGFQMSDLTS